MRKARILAVLLLVVAAVVGHDFGASVAAWCALVRPDVFRALTLMSAPFAGPPLLLFDTVNVPAAVKTPDPVHAALAALPRPRKHYQWFYSTREADADMRDCPQGVHAFLRAYYHHKSADWPDNKPFPLKAWTADELAKLPTYYVMDLDKGMAATVAEQMPTAAHIAACKWLPEAELAVYAAEYARNGFQGGLQWYRCGTTGRFISELEVFSGRTIDVPSCFISGKQDWGTHQRAGVFEARDKGRVGVGNVVFSQKRTRGARPAGYVEGGFYGEGNSFEWARRFSAHDSGFGIAGASTCRFGVNVHEGIEPRLNLPDAIEVHAGELDRRNFLAAEFFESFGDRGIHELRHG